MNKKIIIYADNSATTRMHNEVFDAMVPYLKENYGNASSIYSLGREAALTIKQARKDIAECINAEENEIFFTSGGSESDNWALKSGVLLTPNKNHIVTSAIEHHAVLHTVQSLVKKGFSASYVGVDNFGLVSTESVIAAINNKTSIVSIMMANNEIGTIEPIAKIAKVCREKGVLFHTDAVQAVGHIKVDVKELGIDMLSLSAHKFRGPKGVGALFIKKGINLPVFIEGGAQENSMRAGTENVAGIFGMAKALKIATNNLKINTNKILKLRNRLMENILKFDNTRLTGHPEKRLPGSASFCFEGVEGESMILDLNMHGICASSGSACTSKSLEASHVLLAIGLPHEIAHGSLRITLSEENTEKEIDYIISVLKSIIDRLRLMSPLWEKIIKKAVYH
ncbi:MAG: cysteine desulfurase NifS [Oscillospiraceae bacterium]|jgi:cysteine desulfurase|nr:cysteine desulfurase NifS [Oscillospiraceae bacterium]